MPAWKKTLNSSDDYEIVQEVKCRHHHLTSALHSSMGWMASQELARPWNTLGSIPVLVWFSQLDAYPKARYFTECTECFFI